MVAAGMICHMQSPPAQRVGDLSVGPIKEQLAAKFKRPLSHRLPRGPYLVLPRSKCSQRRLRLAGGLSVAAFAGRAGSRSQALHLSVRLPCDRQGALACPT